jgi:hypothetical protein
LFDDQETFAATATAAMANHPAFVMQLRIGHGPTGHGTCRTP